MSKSEQLFGKSDIYSKLCEDAKAQGLFKTVKLYEKRANDCKKEALQALAEETKESGE